MPDCTTCRGTGIDPDTWPAFSGQFNPEPCPTCHETGLRLPRPLPRVPDPDLTRLARLGAISDAELQAERCWRENERPTPCVIRKALEKRGLGPPDLDDGPSAFRAGAA